MYDVDLVTDRGKNGGHNSKLAHRSSKLLLNRCSTIFSNKKREDLLFGGGDR